MVLQDSHLTVGHAVEVIGKVDQNLHVKVQAATDFGTSIGTFFSLVFGCEGMLVVLMCCDRFQCR
jgi:hypothetical protein